MTQASCIVAGSGDNCDRFHVRYDTSNLSTYSNDYLYRAGCHEFGHTVGLQHREVSGSCMRQNIANAATQYSTHDKNHINGRY